MGTFGFDGQAAGFPRFNGFSNYASRLVNMALGIEMPGEIRIHPSKLVPFRDHEPRTLRKIWQCSAAGLQRTKPWRRLPRFVLVSGKPAGLWKLRYFYSLSLNIKCLCALYPPKKSLKVDAASTQFQRLKPQRWAQKPATKACVN